MKKILQVMPEFGLAGAEKMCADLSIELEKNANFSVTIVSLYEYHSSITERLEKNGIRIIYLEKKPGFDISIILKLKKIMVSEKIELVHTHRYTLQYAFPAAVLAGVKSCVHTVHNIATKEINSFRRKFASVLYSCNRVVPVGISPLVCDSISKEYGLPIDSFPMIFNGINLTKCLPKSNYEVNGKFQFIHVGRFSEQKNHKIIIQSFKNLIISGFDVSLKLIGDGLLKEKYMAEIKQIGLEPYVNFMGLQDNVFPLLQESDCFILPSLYEGMPISLIEAMGTGLPVIVSNVGGMPDMVKNEVSGLLIEPSAEELYNAMKRMIIEKNLREKIGKNALKSSKQFSVEKMTHNYISIYDSLLSK